MHLVVREHERIPVVAERQRPDERALTVAESELLLRTCEREGIAAVRGAYRSVKFRSFCGVVQAGTLLVEVLPKIAQDDGFDRAMLLRMIALASDLPVARLDADKLALQKHSVLLALVRWFCDELARQLHQGMLKRYVTDADALASIRGRWRPDIDAARHAGRPSRLHCEFDELTANNPYNRALKAALRRVATLVSQSQDLSRKVAQLLGWMAHVDDVAVQAAQLDELPMDRLTQRYARALMMARWFLSAQAPDLRQGPNHGLALLFDMNVLFQRMLGVLIRRALPKDLHLREEGPRNYLATDQLGRRQFQMRPDLCILRGEKVLAIADAKWKLLDSEARGGRHGIDQADAYQLHAYATAYGCDRVALWYPRPSAADPHESAVWPTYALASTATSTTPSKLLIQPVRIATSTTPGGWSELMAIEVGRHLRTLLDAQQALTPAML